MSTLRRRHFERIIFWQKGVGNILDLSARGVRMSSGPDEQADRATTAAGTQATQRRSMSLALPITDEETSRFARYMRDVEDTCEHRVGAYMLGADGSQHISWLEATSLAVTNDGGRLFGLSAAVTQVQTSVFHPAVAEASDLLAMTPWEGSTEENGELTGLRRGYEGPRWQVGAEASVDSSGTLQNATTATIKVVYPAWGSALDVQTNAGAQVDHTLRAYDWSGSQIESSTGTLTVPALTWKVEIEVNDPVSRPALVVPDAGEPQGVLDGGTPGNCTRVSNPNWPQTVLTATTT